MIRRIIKYLKKRMSDNETYAKNIGVEIGSNCSIMSTNFGSEPYLIEIGNHVQITKGVHFYTHGGSWVFRQEYPKFDFFGKIKIGNNVYIGNNAQILPGVTIEDNVIIGAGAVVVKSVPKNSIVGGNPAKLIGQVDDFFERANSFNLNTKGMNESEKKLFLTNLSEDKFIKKEFYS